MLELRAPAPADAAGAVSVINTLARRTTGRAEATVDEVRAWCTQPQPFLLEGDAVLAVRRERVGLAVDPDNPTGALRLYEHAGTRVVERFEIWEKSL